MNRRKLLIAAMVAPIATAFLPSSARAHADDAQILAAWSDRSSAYDRYHSLDRTVAEGPQGDAIWAEIDRAEQTICDAVAMTPEGAEIQLWVAFHHTVGGTVADDDAIRRRDLNHFQAQSEDLDWNERMAVAALTSIRNLSAVSEEARA
ncbi:MULTISPECIES: hypothetical protein [Novosphingobium]|uniref:hypothetical protein n=1 Tax=Novosphingobium TaxID=165696 RepID=UPI0022F2A4A5|nr:hypothetical protein [Novosphingobium resinovorum]GLK44456.1 hypothetical protein GCM10017612_23760 [Novosphingobium resinovorum]